MDGFLRLKKSNCKNCYKCIRHCPVKSIRFSGNQAHIVGDECILCGRCFVVCPQNAKVIASEREKTAMLLSSGNPVVVSIAPSFYANFNNVGIAEMERALQKLGFTAAEETAAGATVVAEAYEKLIRDRSQEIVISSCCPSVNLLIQKHFPETLKYLAEVATPVQVHALDLKKRYSGAKIVFIGPCIAKKDEAVRYEGFVDAVLTFEELSQWFADKSITLESMPLEKRSKTSFSGNIVPSRLFPTTNGILKSMQCNEPGWSYLAVDGAENCIAALQEITAGTLHNCFIEMSICAGSCVGGPVTVREHNAPVHSYAATVSYAAQIPESAKTRNAISDTLYHEVQHSYPYIGLSAVIPSDEEIQNILKSMGKTCPELELNCGSCGYDTCREKAIAIYQGKATIEMCLPFLKEKAETFSGIILDHTPNGILVLNEDCEVQQLNRSACRLMNLKNPADVLGEQVVCILDPQPFMDVLQSGTNLIARRMYLAEYKRYAEVSIIYDRVYHVLISIMRDVTGEETERTQKEKNTQHTIEITDTVIDKQMRVVQEIASLLGETAAETKIALTKLKETLTNE